MNFGQNLYQWFLSNAQSLVLMAIVVIGIYLGFKREFSKLMWALGNYSRFIRPGAVRLSVFAFDQAGNLIPGGDSGPDGLTCPCEPCPDSCH